MEAKVVWKGGMSFAGSSESGFIVPLGTSPSVGGDDDGFRPLELIAVGLAGCTAMDVVSILKKKRQEVSTFEVNVHAQQNETHPKVFTHLLIEYVIKGENLSREAVERAVELSAEKYCPAQAMLKQATPMELIITFLD